MKIHSAWPESVQLPLVQAPMAGVQGHRLAAAVARTGALGSLPAAMLTLTALQAEIEAFRAATPAAYNLNFFCHRPPETDLARDQAWLALLAPYAQAWGLESLGGGGAQRTPFGAEQAAWLESLASELRPAVLSFHFGLPEPGLLKRMKALGLRIWSSATTVDEARWLEAAGVDAIIVQGLEAGGHRGHFLSPHPGTDLSGQLPLQELLPAVRQAVACPLIAAGGIADAQAVAQALAAGAVAVQAGSAFLRAEEADTSTLHRAALSLAGPNQTELTRLFTGRPARGLQNRLMCELGAMNALAPDFPLAGAALTALRAAAEKQGNTDFTPLWSGTEGYRAQAATAADIVGQLLPGKLPSRLPEQAV